MNPSLQKSDEPNFSHGQLLETNEMFAFNHNCYKYSVDKCPCNTWATFKQPNKSKPSDLYWVAHRGVWGNNTQSFLLGMEVGGGPPENSASAINAAKNQVQAIEVDIMGTKDLKNQNASNKLILSHDYSLNRLSDYTGSKYWFELSYKEVTGRIWSYTLKRRNGELTHEKYLTYESLLNLLKNNNLVALIDIKALQKFQKGNTTYNANYDPNTDAGKLNILENYADIFRECYKVAKEKGLEHHIAFKTSYSYNILRNATRLNDVELSKILYMPMRRATQQDLTETLNFIDDWTSVNLKKSVIAVETNFTTLESLTGFDRGEKTYNNVFDYVSSKGLRPAIFSEEPVGPKGTVNRITEWKMKDTRQDIRGDHFALMSIKEFRTAVITTDRMDVWKQINDAYNNRSANLLSANSISNITKIEKPGMNENMGINARYESGNIIISGLEGNHIGNDVFLYDLQGHLMFKDIVKTEPQMIITRNLQAGVYVLNISGNQQVSIKIMIN
jgi:glycerophosphoryl diester phosphodiesterase